MSISYEEYLTKKVEILESKVDTYEKIVKNLEGQIENYEKITKNLDEQIEIYKKIDKNNEDELKRKDHIISYLNQMITIMMKEKEEDRPMTNIKALEIINAMVYDFALCVNTDILDYSKEEQLEAMKIAKNVLTNECNN